MDIRDAVLRLPGRTGTGDPLALGDALAPPDLEVAQVRERRLVTVAGQDRDGEPVRRHLAGEGHLAGRGCADEVRLDRDVDSAMLAAGVGVVSDGVPAEDRPVRRP